MFLIETCWSLDCNWSSLINEKNFSVQKKKKQKQSVMGVLMAPIVLANHSNFFKKVKLKIFLFLYRINIFFII